MTAVSHEISDEPLLGSLLGVPFRMGRMGKDLREVLSQECQSDESEHPRGCHSASPRSRLAEPKTGGIGDGDYYSTLVVAQTYSGATTRVE